MARKAVLQGGKRDELLKAALHLFMEKGYDATSVADILSAVGGEVGMFYHYFKSKKAIYEAAIEHFIAEYAVDFRSNTQKSLSGDPAQTLDTLLTLMASRLRMWYAMRSPSQAGTPDEAFLLLIRARLFASLTDDIETLLTQGFAQGSIPVRDDVPPRALAGFLLYGVSGVLDLSVAHNVTEAELAQRIQSARKLVLQLLNIPNKEGDR